MLAQSARFCATLGVDLKPGKLRYVAQVGDSSATIYLLKAQDIGRMLATQLLDLGLTGDEWLMETGVPPEARCLKTDGYRATVSLLVASDNARSSRCIRSIATPYPRLTRRLMQDVAPAAEILPVGGSSEALVPDLADACVDVVESGNTAALNALVVRQPLCEVTTHLARSAGCPSTDAALIVDRISQIRELAP
jgi:ATP phosphoribosyltransferase